MKKFVSLLLVFTMLATLSACGGNTDESKKKNGGDFTEINVEKQEPSKEDEKSKESSKEEKAESNKADEQDKKESFVAGNFYLSGSFSIVNGVTYFSFIPEGEDEYISTEENGVPTLTLNGYKVEIDDEELATELRSVPSGQMFYAEIEEVENFGESYESFACICLMTMMEEDKLQEVITELGLDNVDDDRMEEAYALLWSTVKERNLLTTDQITQIDESYAEYKESVGAGYVVSSIDLEGIVKKEDLVGQERTAMPKVTADLKRENVNISELTSSVVYNPTVDVTLCNNTGGTYIISFEDFDTPDILKDGGVQFISEGTSFWIYEVK